MAVGSFPRVHCPKCRESLEPLHEGLFEDILYHRCRGCGVLWLSSESLDRLDENVLVDASRIEWTERDIDAGLACPSCVERMRADRRFNASPMAWEHYREMTHEDLA